MVGVDREGVIVLVNRQTQRVFGYSREELLGEQVDMLVPERFHRTHQRHRRRYFDDPHTRPMGGASPLFGLRKDGSEFPAEISLSSIKTEAGTLAVTAIRDVTERLVAESIANAETHRRAIVAAMLRAEQAERARIATALHDDTVQVMTASLISLDRACKALGSREPVVLELLESARTSIRDATERTRLLTFELRPAVLHNKGPAPAITSMVEEAGREIGADVTVKMPRGRFDAPVEELVYRTVQEAITNVRRHSGARHIAVTIERRRGSLHGLVADDGRGFVPAEPFERANRHLHIGMETMIERVRVVGGELEVESHPGRGTRISFDVPLRRRLDAPTPVTRRKRAAGSPPGHTPRQPGR